MHKIGLNGKLLEVTMLSRTRRGARMDTYDFVPIDQRAVQQTEQQGFALSLSTFSFETIESGCRLTPIIILHDNLCPSFGISFSPGEQRLF